MKASSIATLWNVTESALPQDMKPELEVPNMAEGFKPAIEKGALKHGQKKATYSEFYTSFSDITKKDLLPIYNQRITNWTFPTKHNTENLVCFP